MKRILLALATFASVIFLPWPCTAVLAILSALYVPLLPLAAGLFGDVLYWTPSVSAFPLGTALGAALSVAALFVRSRLTTGIIGG